MHILYNNYFKMFVTGNIVSITNVTTFYGGKLDEDGKRAISSTKNMTSQTMSTKIAAGMDRWQNTLEDMMHLRSSNNQVFKDNYWVSYK